MRVFMACVQLKGISVYNFGLLLVVAYKLYSNCIKINFWVVHLLIIHNISIENIMWYYNNYKNLSIGKKKKILIT